jgi:hypothetical protein
MSGKGPAISKLIEAIRQASLHQLISALDDGCDIEEADQHGYPGLPLRTACFSGKVEIVRELINRGANINAAGADGPGMPLRLALRAGNTEIIRLLLSSGAEVPPGVTLPADLPAETEKSAPATPEIPALEFAPAPKESTPADFLPEHAAEPASPPENYPVDEEVDITASYGLDTNLLNMDMLRFDEQASKAEATAQENSGEAKKGSFWKSGRRS